MENSVKASRFIFSILYDVSRVVGLYRFGQFHVLHCFFKFRTDCVLCCRVVVRVGGCVGVWIMYKVEITSHNGEGLRLDLPQSSKSVNSRRLVEGIHVNVDDRCGGMRAVNRTEYDLLNMTWEYDLMVYVKPGL